MDFLKSVLPWLGTAATGGVPALIGMAAKTIGDAIGEKIDPTPEAIEQAVRGATPEQMLALQESDRNFKLQMQAAGFKDKKDMAVIELKREAQYIDDTKDARKTFSANDSVMRLGIAVLVGFGVVMSISVYGAYELVTGGMTTKDPGVVAAVFTFVGTIVGYVAALAQQVVGYFFGSSAGSKENRQALADAVSALGKK